MMNNVQRITLALNAVITQPVHDEQVIASFFTTDYRQTVNGIELEYATFVAHMAKLKQMTQTMDLNILAIAQQGNQVLTHHQVNVTKKSGASALTEVFACFTLEGGRIQKCQELTRLISGSEQDKKLGSTY